MLRTTADKNMSAVEKAYNDMGIVAKRPEQQVFNAVVKGVDGSPDIIQVTIVDEGYIIYESAIEYKQGNVKIEDIISSLIKINEFVSIGYFSYNNRGYLKFRTSCLTSKDALTTEECIKYIKLCIQSMKQVQEELADRIGPSIGEKGVANESQSYVPKRNYVDHMIG